MQNPLYKWDVRRDLDVIKRHTWIEGNSRKNRTWSSGKQVDRDLLRGQEGH